MEIPMTYWLLTVIATYTPMDWGIPYGEITRNAVEAFSYHDTKEHCLEQGEVEIKKLILNSKSEIKEVKVECNKREIKIIRMWDTN